MRKRSRTEMGTFSASAIDLFASALGAFIIITVILFPYFPNLSPDPLKKIIDMLKGELEVTQVALEEANDENDVLTTENDKLKRINDKQANDILDKDGKIASLTKNVEDAKTAAGDKDKLIADLEGMLDGTAFLGVEPTTDSFQLILDMSGSIDSHRDKVRSVVATVLERINSGKKIRIMTYQGDVSSPFIEYWPSPNSFKQNLTAGDVSEALKFVEERLAGSGGGTPTFVAMDRAISEGNPSDIILVTDGLPQIRDQQDATKGDINNEVRRITSSNGSRHKINIIATGQFSDPNLDDKLAAQALAVGLMATQNGGALIAIP